MLATRRNLMAAAAVLPIAACPATAPAATATSATIPTEPDPAWDRIYTAFQSADANQRALYSVFAAREAEWDAGKAEREPEPKPIESPEFDTSLPLQEALTAAVGPEWLASWEAREAEQNAWKARDDAGYAAFIGDTETRWEAADAACNEALRALIEYPVASLSALAEKAAVITARFGDLIDGDDAKILVADIRRLAGMEA